MEPSFYDIRRERSGFKLIVRAAVLNDDLSLDLRCQLTKEQMYRIKGTVPSVFNASHPTEFTFYLDTDATGHETIIRVFKGKQLSRQLRNDSNVMLKQIILKGITKDLMETKR